MSAHPQVRRLPILLLPIDEAASSPDLDAEHTHGEAWIVYDSCCRRCVAEQTLFASAKAYRCQPPLMDPTKRQQEVLGFLRQFVGAVGRMPTLTETASHFNITTSSVFMHLQRLERRGHVRRRYGRRGIELVAPGGPST